MKFFFFLIGCKGNYVFYWNSFLIKMAPIALFFSDFIAIDESIIFVYVSRWRPPTWGRGVSTQNCCQHCQIKLPYLSVLSFQVAEVNMGEYSYTRFFQTCQLRLKIFMFLSSRWQPPRWHKVQGIETPRYFYILYLPKEESCIYLISKWRPSFCEHSWDSWISFSFSRWRPPTWVGSEYTGVLTSIICSMTCRSGIYIIHTSLYGWGGGGGVGGPRGFLTVIFSNS
jgi:hypothetical protein